MIVRGISLLIVCASLIWFITCVVSEGASRRSDISQSCEWKGTCTQRPSVAAGVTQYHQVEDGVKVPVWTFGTMQECEAAIPKQPRGVWSCEATR